MTKKKTKGCASLNYRPTLDAKTLALMACSFYRRDHHLSWQDALEHAHAAFIAAEKYLSDLAAKN